MPTSVIDRRVACGRGASKDQPGYRFSVFLLFVDLSFPLC